MSTGRPAEDELQRRRAGWRHRGRKRPEFARPPGPGQESVWDYPRPPAIVPDRRLVEVYAGDHLIGRSARAIRVLETASPPTFYLPPDDVRWERLRRREDHSFCEWKGQADYFDLVMPEERIPQAAWTYARPYPEYAAIAGYLSFYPGRVRCLVAGEPVRAQVGGFYGGWITAEIVGPFKGEPGTAGW